MPIDSLNDYAWNMQMRSRIIIRTDASTTIGTGHVMRCLTLAHRLRLSGAEVAFIARELPGNLCDAIAEQGFAVHCLQDAPERDAEETCRVLESLGHVDWVVVDHYGLDAVWESHVRRLTHHLMAIDDLADRPHDCDLLLDQNFFPDPAVRYRGRLPNRARQLLGPRYALLREEFRAIPEAPRQISSKPNVLVFFGGADPSNQTERAVEELTALADSLLAVRVIVGPSNPHRQAIEAMAARSPNVEVIGPVRDMARLMREADLFIGAGGTTNWERCYLGLPTILISVAANQEEPNRALAEAGCAIYLGGEETVPPGALTVTVQALLLNPCWQNYMSKASQALVDGRGVERVTSALLGAAVTIRKARIDDCEAVFQWRNHETTRRHFFNAEPVPFESHLRWFEETLQSPERVLLIGEIAQKPIGVVRYDLNDDQATISIYLVPEQHGRGLGSSLILAGDAWLRAHVPQVRCVLAEVLAENPASLAAFQQAAYDIDHLILHHVYQEERSAS